MMPRFVVLLLFLAAALCSPPSYSQEERRLAPVDEAESDGTWISFRAQLLAAVAKRDLEYVLGVIDRGVRNGSDSPRGVEEFREQWQLDAPDSTFWRELSAALALGSAWLARDDQPRELCAPYLLGKWPRDMDPLANGVVTVREAPVKSAPSAKANALLTLAHVVVPVADWEVDDSDAASKQKWVKIRLKDRDGYVAEEQMRSPIEHAACFVKTDDGWRLTVFGPAGRD
ncbi:MAG: hypothetical protein A3I02_02335 [Betaproteobacteria bacterium RIFCSPLOWO2_02_FULL_67_26]|nr:MAG: hypothetical protein A3I02_02335 [Betaproteobacteria bacterium RIFCSPLOWO2_02_FULL_67_26]